jgi:hypothetical protein
MLKMEGDDRMAIVAFFLPLQVGIPIRRHGVCSTWSEDGLKTRAEQWQWLL